MKLSLIIHTRSAHETEQLGEDVGHKLRGGEFIELISDLGGGKTTFVRGLARGAGSAGHVASPTFTLSKVYKSPHFAVHHFDFYRLAQPGLMEHELQELVGDKEVVVVVEWGDAIQHMLPDKRLIVEIEQLGAEERAIRISAEESLSYLVEGRT